MSCKSICKTACDESGSRVSGSEDAEWFMPTGKINNE